MSEKTLVDAEARRQATLERQRNVLIDAGAGTGKTTLVVARFLELLAPSDGSTGFPIERMAAVTFTRRAAGELRLRIREGLLRELSTATITGVRREALQKALAGLDGAWIGTIHGFADRLLRLEPMASRLSPTYEIVDDSQALELETWHTLVEACEAQRLHELLGGAVSREVAEETELTFADAIEVGVLSESIHYDFNDQWGLDALVSGFIARRDTPPDVSLAAPKPDLKAFRKAIDEFAEAVGEPGVESPAQRFLGRALKTLLDLRDEREPVVIYRALRELAATAPKNVKKKDHFQTDTTGWEAWKLWDKGNAESGGSIKVRLQAPFVRWLAVRLMRTSPAVVALYERVKARHQALDQVDLLLVLRNVLRGKPEARARCQGLFDHLFVDEFQDTDPLQAEVLMFLCEAGASAKIWDEVKLSPGKLTLVGDPKQSIYRFRRADVLMYDAVRRVLLSGPHLNVKLRANFRSGSSLIDWFNHRFEAVLGTPPEDGRQFDPATGEVFHSPLSAGLTADAPQPVWQVPFEGEETTVGPMRELEADAWARCLKWLVETEQPKIRDPLSGERRAVRYGDIAVLSHVTTNLPMLLEAFDRFGVPWSARGGRLFAEDPLHRQFILGLRALADRDDGVAMMALLRPPFFAVDLTDVALERTKDPPAEVVERMAPIRALLTELRRARFERSPGTTARDLLERSAFGRHVALGPNGAQRLERLRELCFALDRIALERGLDFDAATAELRGWIDDAPGIDAPHPVASEVVQVLTVYQAKGLEYPVVAFWDAQTKWKPQRHGSAWVVSRDGAEWAIALKDFGWVEPEDSDAADVEYTFSAAERKRIVYVAATRARDLLLLPAAANVTGDPNYVVGQLLAEGPEGSVKALAPWLSTGKAPAWAQSKPVPAFAKVKSASAAPEAEHEWSQAVVAASAAHFAPIAVSTEAIRVVEAARAEEEDEVAEPPDKERKGRFGREFGSTVHRAIALKLLDGKLSVVDAVARAAREWELSRHLEEAEADVQRTLIALTEIGVVPGQPENFAVEYPVAVPHEGQLLGGFIDLLATKGGLSVIDFKTDTPPASDTLDALPHYQEQVRSYARILEQGGLAPAGQVRAALLFTATGRLVWVPR